MGSTEDSDTADTQDKHIEDWTGNKTFGDQNTVQGGASNGGIIVQGGQQHQIEVNQYFGVSAPAQRSDSLFADETIPKEHYEPETVRIPEGEFWMGNDDGKSSDKPRHQVSLPFYRISKYPVLNREYAVFITQSETEVSAPPVGFTGLKPIKEFENQPVKGVTLKDARAYCQWLNEVTKPIDNEPRKYGIPNEAQLEKIYHGDYGCSDIFEEIYLWTCTLWGESSSSPDYVYPWTDTDGRNNPDAKNQIRRVVCKYKKVNGADRWQRESRNGQYPEKPFAPERYSFRVVMNV